MGELRLIVEVLPHAKDFGLPKYSSAEASGLDLRMATEGDISLPCGRRMVVPTGLKIRLPAGTEGQVRSRSGLALRQGIFVMNSPGTIDADYRGELKVILCNLSDSTRVLRRGQRIAQLVVSPVIRPIVEPGQVVGDSLRGEAGFGSTG